MAQYKFGVIIQARTGSTRFPKKIVRSVDGGKSFLHILLSRLLILQKQFPLIVATTENKQDDVIEKIANSYSIPVFRGSEQNVLSRFIACATQFNLNTIIRVCSDNPFIDIEAIQKLANNYQGEDYLSYSVNDTPAILTHYGFFTEIVSLVALKELEIIGDSNCMEHVTNCIYSQPGKFVTRFIPLHISTTNIRCTLDTEIDFQILTKIYFFWYEKKAENKYGYQELVRFIEKNPKLLEAMDDQIKQNTK